MRAKRDLRVYLVSYTQTTESLACRIHTMTEESSVPAVDDGVGGGALQCVGPLTLTLTLTERATGREREREANKNRQNRRRKRDVSFDGIHARLGETKRDTKSCPTTQQYKYRSLPLLSLLPSSPRLTASTINRVTRLRRSFTMGYSRPRNRFSEVHRPAPRCTCARDKEIQRANLAKRGDRTIFGLGSDETRGGIETERSR